MAKKKKKRRGVRTYAPHSFATIIYPLFGFLSIAAMVAFIFLPMLTFAKEGEAALTMTGLDFIRLCLRKFLPFLSLPVHQSFEAYYDIAHPTNELLIAIVKFRNFIYLGIVAFIVLGFIFAIIQLIFVLIWFFAGKSEKPTLLCDFALISSGLFLFGIGLAYMYCFFYHYIIDAAGFTVNINFSKFLLILLAVIFLSTALVYVTYHLYFKDRIAMEKRDASNEPRKSAIVDTSEGSPTAFVSAPAPEQSAPQATSKDMNNLPVYDEKKEAPRVNAAPQAPKGTAAVIKVGDTAYAKNKNITEAVIPEGIHSLGSSAFADCRELVSVSIPSSIIDIGFNCFMNTPKLTSIKYNGTVERWKKISRGSNWLHKSGTKTVQCLDGQVNVDTRH